MCVVNILEVVGQPLGSRCRAPASWNGAVTAALREVVYGQRGGEGRGGEGEGRGRGGEGRGGGEGEGRGEGEGVKGEGRESCENEFHTISYTQREQILLVFPNT